MSASEEIFRVTDKWGDEIVLTEKDWSRIITKKPGVSRDRTDNPPQNQAFAELSTERPANAAKFRAALTLYRLMPTHVARWRVRFVKPS